MPLTREVIMKIDKVKESWCEKSRRIHEEEGRGKSHWVENSRAISIGIFMWGVNCRNAVKTL